MISAIICSANDARFAKVSANLSTMLRAEPHEIIRIRDARSLSEGYTRGIAQSRGEHLLFCHDDIEVVCPDLGARLREHLSHFDLVGIAGTTRLITGEWISAGPPYIHGQIAQVHPSEGYVVRIFGVSGRTVSQVQAIDGVFFAARRRVVENIRFDSATFDGFHLYDLDFSFASYLAGFRLGVVDDIPIIHASWGNLDEIWRMYADRFVQKYAGSLARQEHRPFAVTWIRLRTKLEVLEVMRGIPNAAPFQIIV